MSRVFVSFGGDIHGHLSDTTRHMHAVTLTSHARHKSNVKREGNFSWQFCGVFLSSWRQLRQIFEFCSKSVVGALYKLLFIGLNQLRSYFQSITLKLDPAKINYSDLCWCKRQTLHAQSPAPSNCGLIAIETTAAHTFINHPFMLSSNLISPPLLHNNNNLTA